MLTLVHAPRSRSSSFLWLLEEVGEPYDIQYVSIRRGDGSGGGWQTSIVQPDHLLCGLNSQISRDASKVEDWYYLSRKLSCLYLRMGESR